MRNLLASIACLTSVVLVTFEVSQAQEEHWDNCRIRCLYETAGNDHRLKNSYLKYAQLMTKIRDIHHKHHITGTVLLYDNSIFINEHTASSSSSSSSSGSSSGSSSVEETPLTPSQIKSRLEKFQRLLGILALMAMETGTHVNNPVYLAQFDQNSAWSCAEWRCLGGCDAIDVFLQDTNSFTESKRRERLDEACYIAEVAQHDHKSNKFCGGDTQNRLAIAIVNSPFSVGNLKHDSHEISYDRDPSCCAEYKHRMAIGHYRASEDDLREWSTHESDGTYVHMDDADLEALDSLTDCMLDRCGCSSFNRDLLFERLSGSSNSTESRFEMPELRAFGNEECQISQPRYSYQTYTRATNFA